MPNAHCPLPTHETKKWGGRGEKHKKVCAYKCREPGYPKMPINRERDIQTVVNICVIFESNVLPSKNKINLRWIEKFHLRQRLKWPPLSPSFLSSNSRYWQKGDEVAEPRRKGRGALNPSFSGRGRTRLPWRKGKCKLFIVGHRF